jgi:hypothetical protein
MSSLTAKAIQNEEAKIRTADIDALAEALESAIKGSDTIAAQAAQNQLLRRGSGGLEAFNTTIGANPARGDLRSDLAANIRDNHAGVMDKDWGTREWATAKSDPNDPSKQDMTMQQAQDKAHGRVAQSGMSTEEFAGLSTKAQERVLSDDGARSKLSTVTLQTLGDESTTLGAKISQDIRDQLNNEIGLRGGVSRERKKPLDARARQRK